MKLKILKIILIILIFPKHVFSNTSYFEEGINLFKINKFDEAKFKFEQDIVFNPKMNYLIYTYQKFLKI